MNKFKLEFELPEVDHDAGVMITLPHHKVHEGMMYSVSHIFETIAENANAEILFKTDPNKVTDLNAVVGAEGKAFIYIYREPENSDLGTKIAIIPLNQVKTSVYKGAAYHSPTITDTGTELKQTMVPAGSKGQTAGGTAKTGAEFSLKRDTFYLFRVTSKKSGNASISIDLEFYEKDI